jgi:hypothetical protein
MQARFIICHFRRSTRHFGIVTACGLERHERLQSDKIKQADKPLMPRIDALVPKRQGASEGDYKNSLSSKKIKKS